MKKLRISFKSFEKSLDKFIEKRILGVGFNKNVFRQGVELGKEQPLFVENFVVLPDKIITYNFSQLIDTDNIREVKRKMILSYKGKPFKIKSGYSVKPLLENPVRNFLISWNFDNNFLYFKFFVRFRNGSRNIKCRQMKIKWNNS